MTYKNEVYLQLKALRDTLDSIPPSPHTSEANEVIRALGAEVATALQEKFPVDPPQLYARDF